MTVLRTFFPLRTTCSLWHPKLQVYIRKQAAPARVYIHEQIAWIGTNDCFCARKLCHLGA